jgi:glutamate carboxypeptidase
MTVPATLPMMNGEQARSILGGLRARQAEMVGLLEKFVRAESPTDAKPAVDRFGRLVAAEWQRRGARVEVVRQSRAGHHLRIVWSSGTRTTARPLLVLGHLDTVYPAGTLRTMPFRVWRGRAFGPGTFDMKGGLVLALFAARVLRQLKIPARRPVIFLWTSDEETGSETSRALIEREARRSEAVLVLEPAGGPEGRLKTQRKGVGTAELRITGRAAHAGLDPQGGINAVQEMALQLARIARFNDMKRGTTVSPTQVEGGTRSNVIPAAARVVLDLRAERRSDMRKLERRLRSLRPILPGARIELRGGFSRPPLERRASAALFARAAEWGEILGLKLGETFAGGGSDGNFTAALGVPTLDGLGAVGEDPHSVNENVVIRALPERAALLATLLATI